MTPFVAAGIAGVVAVLATVSVEKLGGRWGGVLATMPTTIVPASFALWTTTDASTFADAMAVVPAGMGANAAFLFLWGWLPRLTPSIPALVALTLAGWFTCAILAVATARTVLAAGFSPLILCVGGGLLLLAVGVVATRHPQRAPAGRHAVGPLVVLARGVFAAASIFVALQLGRSAGGVVAGVATVFPAIFLTTMVAVRLAQGADVQQGATGPMILGTSCVPIYALTASLCFPNMGPIAGSALAWCVAVGAGSLPIALWLRRSSAGLTLPEGT